jgi:alkylation response protein AidB-like acyl-CoA dehydrogenase
MLGLALPEDCGGAGLGWIELALLLQQTGRVVAPIPAVASLASAGLTLARHGSAEQKTKWLSGVARGETILTAALVDPDTRDAYAPTAIATASSGGYVVRGTFANVPFVDQAARVLVPARVEKGYGLFLVDPKGKGVIIERQVGTNDEPLTSLTLDVVVAPDDVVVAGAKGAEALRELVDDTTLAYCAVALGIAEGALYLTAGYATERKQFGIPIGAFQGVTQRIGDAYIDVQSMRVSFWKACWSMQEGRPYADALDLAKAWASEAGHRVVSAAQHVHGGMGFDRDYPAHRFFLSMKQLEHTLGGSAAHLAAVGKRLASG